MKNLLGDLKSELRMWESQVIYAKSELATALIGLNKCKLKLRQAEKDSKKESKLFLLKKTPKLSSIKRYAMFNKVLKADGVTTVYRDRIASGLSVKPECLSKKAAKVCAKLADTVTRKPSQSFYDLSYGDDKRKPVMVTRYIFNVSSKKLVA